MTKASTHLHPSAYPVIPIINALKRDANRPLLQMVGEEPWTGGQVLDAISQYAQALKSRGIAGGKRVALLARNSVEVVILHNAIGFAGAALVTLHPLGSADDHLFAIEDGEVEALIYDPTKFEKRAAELTARTDRLKRVLSLGDGEAGENLKTLAASVEPGPLVRPVVPADYIPRLSYSGGTTGTPKAIPGNLRSGRWRCRSCCKSGNGPSSPGSSR